MKSGWRCYLNKKAALPVLIVLLILSGIYWWRQQPETPQQMFEVRCASCHELQIEKLCEFPSELRADIVDVMRRDHGAAEVISEHEARLIQQYFRGEFRCR